MANPPDDKKRNDPNFQEVSDVTVPKNKSKDAKDTNIDQETSKDETVHSRGRRQSRNIAALLAGVAGIALYYGTTHYHPSQTAGPPTSATPQKGYIKTAPATLDGGTQTASEAARITISPTTVKFADTVTGQDSQHIAVVLKVGSGAYRINSVSIPYNHETGLSASSENCDNKTITAGQQCSIDVVFHPDHPVSVANLSLDVQGLSYAPNNGASKEYSAYVPLFAVAKAPVTPPEPPATTTAATTSPDGAAQSGRGNPFGPDRPDASTNSAGQSPQDVAKAREQQRVAEAASEQKQAQNAYLASEASPTIGPAQLSTPSGTQGGDGQPPMTLADMMRPEQTTWPDKSIQSTYPYDMSRLITAGTPIPAVIQYSIDSRYHTTAVASVERDIYGEDGRLVILEKGSRIIGSASSGSSSGGSVSGQSGSSSSSEKMQISWRRIVRPDGVIFSINGTSGDAMGRGGIPSVNDDRPWDRFGAGVLTSILTAVGVGATGGTETSTNTGGVTSGGYSSGGTSSTTLDARSLAAQSLQSGLTPLATEFSNEHLALPEIHIVPQGTRFVIYLSDDIELRPVLTRYQARMALRAKQSGSQMPAYAVNPPSTSTTINTPQYQYPGGSGATMATVRAPATTINPYNQPQPPTLAASTIQPASQPYSPTTSIPSATAPPYPSTSQQATLNSILNGQ